MLDSSLGIIAQRMIMIGDRQSDSSGGREQGLITVAATWGYGSRNELETAIRI